jgi:anaerobic selenocysteine-containing dehydrogenase
MHKVVDSEIGISEYVFTQRLFEAFDFDGLESEAFYLNAWLKQCREVEGQYLSPSYEALPYEEGFGEESEDEFEFIEEYDDDFISTKQFTKVRTSKKNRDNDEKFWLLSPKSNKALNTQFDRSNKIQLHSDKGFKEGERVKVTSSYGEYEFIVKINDDIRKDCVVITNNTTGVNYLTPSLLSDEGDNACYQEVKVEIERT